MPVDILNQTGAAAGALASHPSEDVAHGMPSLPTGALDNPEQEPEPQKEFLNFLHLACKLDELNTRIGQLIDLEEALLADRIKERTFVDTPVQISKNIEYTVDYLERKFLYIYSNGALTLNLNTGGTIAVTANVWKNISVPRGTKITVPANNDNAPAAVTIRACDVYMG